MQRRWTRRPEGSTWGDFGDDDQIGRLNLITPERRLAAMHEVSEGRVFPLSLPLDLPGPGIQPPFRQPPRITSTVSHNLAMSELFGAPGAIDVGNDDAVTISLQYSTQWDSLAHVGAMFDVDGSGEQRAVYYNGYKAHEDVLGSDQQGGPRALRLGIETQAISCVQGRGVLVNLRKAFGDAKTLVGYERMMATLEAQRVEIRPGDILCLYTGYADALLAAGQALDAERIESCFADLDGHDLRLLNWITDSNIAALACDNMAIEAKPEGHASGHVVCSAGAAMLPLHHHCLFKLGLPLGELWYLGELAAWLDTARRSAFLLTAPPLRLPGAVGSPLMPVATV